MRTLFSVAALGFLVLAAQAGDEAVVKKELDALRGNWNVVRGGDPDMQFSMVENSLQIRIGGASVDLKFTVNPAKKPREIDMTWMLKDGSDTSMLGIYELDGDTLKICFDEPGKKRPTEFKAKANSKQSSFVLQREKKQKE
jgi:uncharacterized protein (TIGR03067 family)